MRRALTLPLVLMAACFVLTTGCAGRAADGGDGKSTDGPAKGATTGTPADTKGGTGGGGDAVAIANPASKNCIDKGGKVELKDSPDGQFGVCVFSDGSRCEEWAFVRNQCEVGKCFEDDGKCE